MRPQQVIGIYKPQSAVVHDPRVSRKLGCGRISDIDIPDFVETRANFPSNFQVYVTSVPIQCDQKCIYDLFKEYGTIRQIKVLTGTVTARRKTLHAVVSYDNKDEAKMALKVKRVKHHEGEFMMVMASDWWKKHIWGGVKRPGTMTAGQRKMYIEDFTVGHESRHTNDGWGRQGSSEWSQNLDGSGKSYRGEMVRPLDLELPGNGWPFVANSGKVCRCMDCGKEKLLPVERVEKEEERKEENGRFFEEIANKYGQAVKSSMAELESRNNFGNLPDVSGKVYGGSAIGVASGVGAMATQPVEETVGDEDVSVALFCPEEEVMGELPAEELSGEEVKLEENGIYDGICGDIEGLMEKSTDIQVSPESDESSRIDDFAKNFSETSPQSLSSPEVIPEKKVAEAEASKSPFQKLVGEEMRTKYNPRAAYEEISRLGSLLCSSPEMSFEKELFRRSRLHLQTPVEMATSSGRRENDSKAIINGEQSLKGEDASLRNLEKAINEEFCKIRQEEQGERSLQENFIDERIDENDKQELQEPVDIGVQPRSPIVKISNEVFDEFAGEDGENTAKVDSSSEMEAKINEKGMDVSGEIEGNGEQANWTWINGDILDEKRDEEVLVLFETERGFDETSGAGEGNESPGKKEMLSGEEEVEKEDDSGKDEWEEEEEGEDCSERGNWNVQVGGKEEKDSIGRQKRSEEYRDDWKRSTNSSRERNQENLEEVRRWNRRNKEDENVNEERRWNNNWRRDNNQNWGDRRRLNNGRGGWNNNEGNASRNNWRNNGNNNWRNNWRNNRNNQNNNNDGRNNWNNNRRNNWTNNGRKNTQWNYVKGGDEEESGVGRGKWDSENKGEKEKLRARKTRWDRGSSLERERLKDTPEKDSTGTEPDLKITLCNDEGERSKDKRKRKANDRKSKKVRRDGEEEINEKSDMEANKNFSDGNEKKRRRKECKKRHSDKRERKLKESGLRKELTQLPGESLRANQSGIGEEDGYSAIRVAIEKYILKISTACPSTYR